MLRLFSHIHFAADVFTDSSKSLNSGVHITFMATGVSSHADRSYRRVEGGVALRISVNSSVAP